MTTSIAISDSLIPDAADAVALYCAVGWGHEKDYDVDQWERVLATTPIIITAYQGDTLIGMLRAMSDGYHETMLNDIIVHPKYQRQGIGRHMMNRFVELQGHTGIYISGFSQNREFFENCGFTVKEQMFVASRAPSHAAA